jgi:hypothetical protein
MRPLDIAIAVSSLAENPDGQKTLMLREELLLALWRQEITWQTYREALAMLQHLSGQTTASAPTSA